MRLWRRICSLYMAACRRWRRDKLSLSAAAHARAMAGKPFWRDRIDGAFLLLFSDHEHCRTRWQRETNQ